MRIARKPMEAVPFIDLAFVLLLFFIAVGAGVSRPGILMELPALGSSDQVPYSRAVVTITYGGEAGADEGFLFFEDALLGEDQLVIGLRRHALEHPEEELVIEADRRVSNERVLAISELARQAGIRKILLATESVRNYPKDKGVPDAGSPAVTP